MASVYATDWCLLLYEMTEAYMLRTWFALEFLSLVPTIDKPLIDESRRGRLEIMLRSTWLPVPRSRKDGLSFTIFGTCESSISLTSLLANAMLVPYLVFGFSIAEGMSLL